MTSNWARLAFNAAQADIFISFSQSYPSWFGLRDQVLNFLEIMSVSTSDHGVARTNFWEKQCALFVLCISTLLAACLKYVFDTSVQENFSDLPQWRLLHRLMK